MEEALAVWIGQLRLMVMDGGNRVRGYTHELVANVYALLMIRRWRNVLGRPEWLNEEIYKLVVRVTRWTE